MSATDDPAEFLNEAATDLEPVEELEVATPEAAPLLSAPEFTTWKISYLNETIPSLFLDRSLRIMQANESFCRMYGCEPRVSGQYFTQFFSHSFDDSKSADLFRSILSPAGGYAWHGRVEKIGMERLLMISKVWVLPLGVPGAPPKAYGAVCLDMTDEHRHLLQSTFTSLLGAARLKDNDTGNHIERVNRYAKSMAADLMDRPGGPPVDREFVESIGLVAALHDVGKIGTPDDILNKAGQLEAWEWDVMKQHTTNGAYILSTYPNPMAREIALRHHERWDGTGYPHGLSQDLIPLSARIVAVADVYDALRMRRNYKEAYTHEQTMENMVAERGTHFDPYLIDRFVETAESFREVFDDLSDS
jgi:HD-GYP domain-containing protein (c-di-GMP phosphodiesterase class II)